MANKYYKILMSVLIIEVVLVLFIFFADDYISLSLSTERTIRNSILYYISPALRLVLPIIIIKAFGSDRLYKVFGISLIVINIFYSIIGLNLVDVEISVFYYIMWGISSIVGIVAIISGIKIARSSENNHHRFIYIGLVLTYLYRSNILAVFYIFGFNILAAIIILGMTYLVDLVLYLMVAYVSAKYFVGIIE